VNWRAGFRFGADRAAGSQTNDADRVQAFGSSQIEPGRKSAGFCKEISLAKQPTTLVSYWSNGGG
jgi:hypothetical protein